MHIFEQLKRLLPAFGLMAICSGIILFLPQFESDPPATPGVAASQGEKPVAPGKNGPDNQA